MSIPQESPLLNAMSGKILEEDRPWLKVSTDAYRESTDYMDQSLRKQWDRNTASHQSRHPRGSKYKTSGYAHRSKLFRPKTRSTVRRNEAAAAAAFFSNADVVTAIPRNSDDPAQVMSARINQTLLQYRLDHTIPWFRTTLGAFQEAQVYGIVVSKQYWKYAERVSRKKAKDPETGDSILNEDGTTAYDEEIEVLHDKPVVELIPAENFRFDPAADWIDPVASSPYLIHRFSMYIDDVVDRMNDIDPKTGQPDWREYARGEIAVANAATYDSTRKERHGERVDPYEQAARAAGDTFAKVWIHENFYRLDGKDYIWYTVGDQLMLTKPVPIEEVYFTGVRPFVCGTTMIEPHKAHPQAIVEIFQDLQTATNDLQNQRFDNVQLVLNRRYKYRRGAKIDMAALRRNAPGGGVAMEDPTNDLVYDAPPDVTASSYNEQDRLSADLDEIAGNFSAGSVNTNKNLNETVGGMELMSADSNQQTEYLVRVFAETWAEPVLRQLVKLEQAYETDKVILALVANNAGAYTRYGMDADIDKLLNQDVFIKVNVGVGATNPMGRVQKLLASIGAAIKLTPQIAARLNEEEIVKEIMAATGYSDGNRFLKPQDQVQQQPSIDMLKLKLDEQIEGGKLQIDQQRMQILKVSSQIDQQKMQLEAQTKQSEAAIKQMDIDSKERIAQLQIQGDLERYAIQREEAAAKLEMDRERMAMEERLRQGEQRIKMLLAERDATEKARLKQLDIDKDLELEDKRSAQADKAAAQAPKESSEPKQAQAAPQPIVVNIDNKRGTVTKQIDLQKKDGELTGATVTEEEDEPVPDTAEN